MKFVITPNYSDFFEEEAPQLESLIEDIPTSLIIKLVSAINAQLYPDGRQIESQHRIFSFLIDRQPQRVKDELILRYSSFANGPEKFAMYSAHLTLEFLHRALIREVQPAEIEDTTVDQELRVFKALLLIAHQEAGKVEIPAFTSTQMEFFQISTWPTLLNQIELNIPANYMNEIVKAKCFFDFMQFESDYSTYVTRFLELYGVPNSFTYINSIIQIIPTALSNTSGRFSPFMVRVEEHYLKEILLGLSLDITQYSNHFKDQKRQLFRNKGPSTFQDQRGCIFSY